MDSRGRLLGLGLLSLLFTACPKPVWHAAPRENPPASPSPIPSPGNVLPEENVTPAVTSIPRTTPLETPLANPSATPTPLPELFIPRRSYDVAKLFNGLKITSRLQSFPGRIAPVERTEEDSFSVDISLKVRVPAPMVSVADFQIANPALPVALPMLGDLLAHSRVSPLYHGLYALKVKSLQQDLHSLDEILSRHNFFDCGTLLEITNPATGRHALWLQADMDVVADGSDSDRFLEVDGTSVHYQPFTSYRWPKKTPVPSQFLAEKQAKILADQVELASPATAERGQILRKAIAELQTEIGDLQTFSFLISKADPFIVLPGILLRDRAQPFCPRIGDYVAVIYKNKIYPAIFGDVGPNVLVGEASLRLATTLNPRATANNRASSNLDISYLVFPKSADEPAGPPDYEKWRTRCLELLADLGAPGLTVEHWVNILPPMPTPTPPPTPTPTPAPPLTPSPAPSSSAIPSAAPSPQGSPLLSPNPISGLPTPKPLIAPVSQP